MPHSPPVLLEDIRHAAQRIQDFTIGRKLADYGSDDQLRFAMERLFTVIGEALCRLEKVDATLANQITDYRKIIGFRNVLHGYEVIDNKIVWQTIMRHLPILKQQVENLLATIAPP